MSDPRPPVNDTSRHDKPALPADAVTAAENPPGTRRPTEVELHWWAEASRWDRSSIGMDSAWVTEGEFRIIRLPGRALWMTVAEWDAITSAIRDQATAAERERWSARFRDLAATYLPNIMTAEGAQALAKTDPNSPSQVRGRLLLDLADLLDGTR
jgi:hypothetical protein